MAVAVVVCITPPVSEMEMVNETKGLKILWGNCRRGSIILTQPCFPSLQDVEVERFFAHRGWKS